MSVWSLHIKDTLSQESTPGWEISTAQIHSIFSPAYFCGDWSLYRAAIGIGIGIGNIQVWMWACNCLRSSMYYLHIYVTIHRLPLRQAAEIVQSCTDKSTSWWWITYSKIVPWGENMYACTHSHTYSLIFTCNGYSVLFYGFVFYFFRNKVSLCCSS